MSIRSTIVGSYPKVTETGSDQLPRVIDRWQRKLVGDDGLEQELEKVIRRVLQEQEAAGLSLVTDGQIRWEDLPHPFSRSVQGVARGALRRFFDNNTYYRRLEPNGGVSWTESWVLQQFRFASENSKKPVKVSLPGPLTLVGATEFPKGKSGKDFLPRYTDCLKREVSALAAAGVKEIQLEEPALQPEEPLFEPGLEAINEIFRGVKARRWLSLYFFDVTRIFKKLAALDLEVLGIDLIKNPKAEESVKVLGNKEIALGLLDARNTKLESADALRRRVDKISKTVPVDRLWITPNCGLEFLPHEAALKKLELLKQVAS
jgi:5-methyltetrahydropteroyltriglutamate--homocysteine methyltransferase